MTFKAMAAALALLPLLAGAVPLHAHAWFEPQSSLHSPVTFGDVVVDPPAQQSPQHIRSHEPEPRVLMLLGLGLLIFGLRGHTKRSSSSRVANCDRIRKQRD